MRKYIYCPRVSPISLPPCQLPEKTDDNTVSSAKVKSWGWVECGAAGRGAFECSQEVLRLNWVFPVSALTRRKSLYLEVLLSPPLRLNNVINPIVRICEKDSFRKARKHQRVQWIKSYISGEKLWSRLWVLMWSSTSKSVWNASVKLLRPKVSVWCDLLLESCDPQMQIRCVSAFQTHVWE